MDVADKQTPLSLDSKVPFEGFLSQSHQAAVPVEIPREKMAAGDSLPEMFQLKSSDSHSIT